MQNKLTFIILIMLSLKIYPQVVIKDEIILQENDNLDEENLTMPFYGKVEGGVSGGYIFWGWLAKVVIEADGQTQSRSCPNHCNACSITNAGWTINNLPQSTPVIVTVYSHCISGELVEADTRIVSTGQYEYNIEFYSPSQEAWLIATTLKFIATTPPGCGSAIPCDSVPNPPDIDLIVRNNMFGDSNVCDEPDNAAGFKPVWGPFFEVFEIEVCYNEQHQQWQFEFNNEHTLQFNVVIDYCEDNISVLGGILIDDYDEFPQGYGCINIIRDLKNHLNYPPVIGTQTGTYLLKTILLEHELQHKLFFENILLEEKNIFQSDLYYQSPNCEEINNIQEAEIYWMNRINAALIKFWTNSVDRNEKETGLYDRIVHGDDFKFNMHEMNTQFEIYHFIIDKIIDAKIELGCTP